MMRQDYRAGERMFVDFAGRTMPIHDPTKREIREACIFVSVLGASNYTYAEAFLAQDLFSWVSAHRHSFEFFGGVPEVVVPDNAKTSVMRACFYEPDLNPTYQEMAAHYGTVVIPARPRKPRDKAKGEVAVQVVERWILAALRNRTFFSLAELNLAIREAVKELNDRPFRKLEGSRKSLYETLERAALKPLPKEPYEFAEWKRARVNIDYHVEVDKNFYSVPYQLVHEEVDVRLTGTTVELLYRGKRVASHQRSFSKGQFITDPAHRPSSHRRHLEWTPSRLVRWGETVGPNTGRLIQTVLESKPHPEQGYRSCLGIMRLERRYSAERLEAASRRALSIGATSYSNTVLTERRLEI